MKKIVIDDNCTARIDQYLNLIDKDMTRSFVQKLISNRQCQSKWKDMLESFI